MLAGGLSHERDVSLRSGRRVAEALRGTGLEVVERDVDASLMTSLRDEPPACVVPMLHGETGEDGAIREVLELLGLPYVGSRPEACRVAFNKPVAKAVVAEGEIIDVFTAAGLKKPDISILSDEFLDEVLHELALALTDLGVAHGEHLLGGVGADDFRLDVERDVKALERQRQMKRKLGPRNGNLTRIAIDAQTTERPIGRAQPVPVHSDKEWGSDPVVPPLIGPLPLDLDRHGPG